MDNYIHTSLFVKFDLTNTGKYGKNEAEKGEKLMVTGENRRAQILHLLKEQGMPLSGTALAKTFGVSRQVIVQDIALMRAENHSILSTNKGYLYRREEAETSQPKRVFYVNHTTEQVLEEFQIILELGGKVLDVAVEHEIYGYIQANLLIENPQDAQDFVNKLDTCRDNPLKVLTDDCHYHTVTAPSEKLLDLIEADLRAKGYLLS